MAEREKEMPERGIELVDKNIQFIMEKKNKKRTNKGKRKISEKNKVIVKDSVTIVTVILILASFVYRIIGKIGDSTIVDWFVLVIVSCVALVFIFDTISIVKKRIKFKIIDLILIKKMKVVHVVWLPIFIINSYSSLWISDEIYMFSLPMLAIFCWFFILTRYGGQIGMNQNGLYYLGIHYLWENIESCSLDKKENSITFVMKRTDTEKIKLFLIDKDIEGVIEYFKRNQVVLEADSKDFDGE